MQVQFFGIVLFLLAGFFGSQSTAVIDSGTVTGNTFQSSFFKFHYAFPQGWQAENDEIRTEKNRKFYDEQLEKAKAKAKSDTANSKTTIQVFTPYDLLIASPNAISPEGKPPLPHVHIWAVERFSLMENPGDNAKLAARIGKVLREPQEQTISGHKFVRADLVYHDDNYEALFDTVSGKYLIFFEFRGRSEQEINELAKTVESLKFD